MLDGQLIAAALQSRRAYEKFAPYIGKEDMQADAGFWYDVVQDWYERDPAAQSIDRDMLAKSAILRSVNDQQMLRVTDYLASLPEAPSPENVAQVALELKRFNVGMELATAIGARDERRVSKLHKQYGELMAITELRQVAQWEDAVDWHELDEVVGDKKRIRLAPMILTERAGGGALPGHHVLVYGRPEVGKSTFTLNMTRGFLYDGHKVLYVGNEDNINVLKKRMRSRLSGMTAAEVNADPDKANKLAYERETERGGRLLMRHLHRGTVANLEHAVEEFEPSVLVLDQIRNLESAGKESKVERMEQVGIDVRRILSTYGLVGVSVTQANAGQAGSKPKVWLGLEDVDSSKTGLPGAIDLAIGIGADQDMLNRGQRAISLPKNKLSDALNNHEGFIVDFNVQLSKVK